MKRLRIPKDAEVTRDHRREAQAAARYIYPARAAAKPAKLSRAVKFMVFHDGKDVVLTVFGRGQSVALRLSDALKKALIRSLRKAS